MSKYLSIYSKTDGKRLTSYVIGIHADSMDGLEALAKKEYPGAVYMQQTDEEWGKAINDGLIYQNGKLTAPPEPTEEEKREEELKALDADYSNQIGNIEMEMAKAKAIGDDDYFNDLKAEREQLVNEYTEKRGEI